ncbi:MAG: hypothetical protein RL653_2611 [Pseudomonadota bacterium]|jgi:hypothetical protein
MKQLAAKLLRAVGGAIILVLGYSGVFTLRASTTEYPLRGASPPGQMRQVRGAWHVHSTASDGRGTEAEIAAAAAEAGLAFVVLTDHNPTSLPPPRFESGVLLLSGAELSTPVGHLAQLGAKALAPAGPGERPALRVQQAGGMTVLAHPVQQKRPWTDWDEAETAAAGLELYSADSMFRDAQRSPLSLLVPAVGAFLAKPAHAFAVVSLPQEETTARLLQLARSRPRVALCAHDAHGLPPYGDEFRALSMVLPPAFSMPADPEDAARAVRSTLERGEAYCAFTALGGADGFALRGLGPARTVQPGARVQVQLPQPAPASVRLQVWGEARLLEDGRTVEATGPGAFQVEAWAEGPGLLSGTAWRPWLVPSPVRVQAPAELSGETR